jgi:hypothetical protein
MDTKKVLGIALNDRIRQDHASVGKLRDLAPQKPEPKLNEKPDKK